MSNKQILELKPSQTNLRNNHMIQPETKAMMQWILENPFVISLILHGGAGAVFYPFDDGRERPDGSASNMGYLSATQDNDVMRYLSNNYASNHKDFHLGLPCINPGDPPVAFKNGFKNGAEWYPISGSLNDFNYLFSNCLDITVELTCCKKPDASTLPCEWNKNRRSLVSFLKQAHIGVKGLIRNTKGDRVVDGEIEVIGRLKKTKATQQGEYWRILLPGKYNIRAKGLFKYRGNSSVIREYMISDVKQVTVRKNHVTRMDFVLDRYLGLI